MQYQKNPYGTDVTALTLTIVTPPEIMTCAQGAPVTFSRCYLKNFRKKKAPPHGDGAVPYWW